MAHPAWSSGLAAAPRPQTVHRAFHSEDLLQHTQAAFSNGKETRSFLEESAPEGTLGPKTNQVPFKVPENSSLGATKTFKG